MTAAIAAPADLEHRLDTTRVHLDHLARFLAGPDATPELLAGAFESIASVAAVIAAELRGEAALR
ncbi:MAG: hypothetical protein WKF86_07745 [Acidimicrobiales bacterium]